MAPAESDIASLRDALAVLAGCGEGCACLFGMDAAAPATPPDASKCAASPRLSAPSKPLKRLAARKAAGATRLSPREYAARWFEVQSLRKEWKAMATSQKEQLEAAREENAQLCALIASERRSAHKMTRLFRRALLMVAPVPRVPRVVHFGFDHYRGPREEPARHLERLTSVLESASRAFSDGLFAHTRPCAATFREVQFCDRKGDNLNEIGIVFSMAWDLPYAVDEVASALWLQTTRSSPKKSVEWMDLHEDKNLMVSQFIATPTDGSEPMIKHGQLAARIVKADESEDGNAKVIVATTRIRAFEDDQAKGEAHCDTWIRVEDTHRPGGPVSHVQWCRRVRIQPPHAEFATRAQRAEWIRSAISGPMRACEERKLDWSMQAIENALLDASRVQRSL